MADFRPLLKENSEIHDGSKSYAPQGHPWKSPGEEIAVLAAIGDSCLSADAPR
jgi:hypothetical protein